MIAISAVSVAAPPWVDLAITGLPAGTASIRVGRSFAGFSDRVRGDSTTPILGTDARVVDWAAPVGVGSVVYTVSALSATGVVLEVASLAVASVTMDHSTAWLSDPFDPTGGVLVAVMRDDDGTTRTAPSADVVSTMTGLPMALVTRRTMRTRNWALFADTDALAAAVDWILESSSVLLRGSPDCLDHPTGVAYVQAPSVTRTRRMPHEEGVLWQLSGVETRGPSAPPAVSGRTYQDDLDEHPIYSASLAAFPTYLARVRG